MSNRRLDRIAVFAFVAVTLANAIWIPGSFADEERIRIATFNVSLNRRNVGDLANDLAIKDNLQAKQIAEIIQSVRPDVLLLNEFDFDASGTAIERFKANYLQIAQGDTKAIQYEYGFGAPINTGIASGHDLNNNGRVGGPGDAFGFGFFPGQYGMYVLSRFPIDHNAARTFQMFKWQDMPNASLPEADGQPYYDESEAAILRLSSKSHWDLPIQVDAKTIHLLCSHPTPPVFDGPEDRNGLRNYDEIRFWADYVTPTKCDYIYDDKKQYGGLGDGEDFAIAGDMNSDPHDGDSTNHAISQLLSHPSINSSIVPSSDGAKNKSHADGGVNDHHQGDPKHDTSDFSDQRTGNLRLDYVLPSKSLKVVNSGVFWPNPGEDGSDLVDASDHRLVWIDIEL